MWWIIGGAVLTAVLIGAWLYDRRWGVNDAYMPSAAARAEAEAAGRIAGSSATHADPF